MPLQPQDTPIQSVEQESFVPDVKSGEAPSINNSMTLYREVLLSMRIQLRSDPPVVTACKVLKTLLQNITNSPVDEKFRKIRLANDKIKATITNNEKSRFLLELVGFSEVEIDSEKYMICDWSTDLRELQCAIAVLDEVVRQESCKLIAEKLGIALPKPQLT